MSNGDAQSWGDVICMHLEAKAGRVAEMAMIDQEQTNYLVQAALFDALIALHDGKPGDHSELDRVYALCISELEGTISRFRVCAVQGELRYNKGLRNG